MNTHSLKLAAIALAAFLAGAGLHLALTGIAPSKDAATEITPKADPTRGDPTPRAAASAPTQDCAPEPVEMACR